MSGRFRLGLLAIALVITALVIVLLLGRSPLDPLALDVARAANTPKAWKTVLELDPGNIEAQTNLGLLAQPAPEPTVTATPVTPAAVPVVPATAPSVPKTTPAPVATTPSSLPDPLYCTKDPRTSPVVVGVSAGCSVTTTPADRFAASLTTIDATTVALTLRALQPGEGSLTLRDAGGNVRQTVRVQSIAISSNTSKSISSTTLADGTCILYGRLMLEPHRPGLDVRFICLQPRVTVPDGFSERWIASEAFAPDGLGNASTSFQMVRPPGVKWQPLEYVLYQDGVQISGRMPADGNT